MGYRQRPIEEYLGDAAARKPAPGGGSVSALAGGLAAAMSAMSANFTVGRKKFAGVDQIVRSLLAELDACREALLALVDRDVEAYGSVDQAYGMPRDSEEQKASREQAIDAALRLAMQVPLDVMRQCEVVARAAAELVGIGNPNLITDVGVSAILAEAACAAARLNVEINLKLLDDPALRVATSEEMDRMTGLVRESRNTVEARVASYLAS
jgi:formiminotetrahydrofolate cyclodeaminase